jgi:hypothetical protein
VRETGLGSALTTILVPVEAEVRTLLGIPDGYPVAARPTVGRPDQKRPTRLNRNPVEDSTTLERFAGPALSDPAAQPSPPPPALA